MVGRVVSGTIGIIFYNYANKNLPLFDLIIFFYINPIITTILARIFLKDKIKIINWLSVIFAFLGVVIFSFSYKN